MDEIEHSDKGANPHNWFGAMAAAEQVRSASGSLERTRELWDLIT